METFMNYLLLAVLVVGARFLYDKIMGRKQEAGRRMKTKGELIAELSAALSDVIRLVPACEHETTHRGDAIWTICDDCGKEWADDRGGFQPYKEPREITVALALLAEVDKRGEDA